MSIPKVKAWDGKKFLDLQKLTPLALSDPDMKGLFIPDIPHLKILRWTGLYDRSGTPIFEGDIIREEIEFDEGDERIYYVCRWFPQTCSFVWMTYGDTCTDWDNTPEDYPTNVLLAETDKYTICCNEYEKPDWWQLE